MPTPAEIEQQVRFEREAIASGLKKIRDQTDKLQSQSYASATVYGNASIETMLPLVAAEVAKTADSRLRHRQAGQCFAEVDRYLKDVEPEVAAAIACKVLFDKVFSYEDKSSHVVNVVKAIAMGASQPWRPRAPCRFVLLPRRPSRGTPAL